MQLLHPKFVAAPIFAGGSRDSHTYHSARNIGHHNALFLGRGVSAIVMQYRRYRQILLVGKRHKVARIDAERGSNAIDPDQR